MGRENAFDHHSTAEGLHFRINGAPKRSFGDTYFKELSYVEKETLLGQSFLGARLLRRYSRS